MNNRGVPLFVFIIDCSGLCSEMELHHFCEWERKAGFTGESIAPLLTRIKFGTENCRRDEVNPDIRPLPERDCGVIISSKSFPLMPQNTGDIRGSHKALAIR